MTGRDAHVQGRAASCEYECAWPTNTGRERTCERPIRSCLSTSVYVCTTSSTVSFLLAMFGKRRRLVSEKVCVGQFHGQVSKCEESDVTFSLRNKRSACCHGKSDQCSHSCQWEVEVGGRSLLKQCSDFPLFESLFFSEIRHKTKDRMSRMRRWLFEQTFHGSRCERADTVQRQPDRAAACT